MKLIKFPKKLNRNKCFYEIFLKGTIFLFLFLILLQRGNSQTYDLKIIDVDNSVKINSYRKKFIDTIQIKNQLYKIINNQISKGYPAASFDSIIYDSLNVFAYFFAGKKYSTDTLIIFDDRNCLIFKSGSNIRYSVKQFTVESALKTFDDIIKENENNGYPFACIKPIEVKIKDSSIKISAVLERGNKFKINKLIIKGLERISLNFISTYLSINENDDYNEQKIAQIGKKLNDLNFIHQIKTPEIEFYDNKVDIYLYLEEKKANLFSGIIGIVPESETSQKIKLTGELNINLTNSLKQGENLVLNWNALSNRSQKLDMHFKFPYIFKTRFGTEIGFMLQKIDSSLISVAFKAGLDYSLKYNDKISAFFLNTRSFITGSANIDTSLYADSESLLYGFSYQTSQFDYNLNPLNGYFINTEIASGRRKTASFNELISTFKFRVETYIPIYKKLTIKFVTENQYVFTDHVLFENELLRIGGFNQIRGFNQDAFVVDGFSVLSGELRFLYEKESNVFTFVDIGRLQREKLTESVINFPVGLGFGSNFTTKAGIFSISYALGKLEGNGFQLSNSKIHIGYLNRF